MQSASWVSAGNNERSLGESKNGSVITNGSVSMPYVVSYG